MKAWKPVSFPHYETFLAEERFHSILHYYVDLNCFLIPVHTIPLFSKDHHRYPEPWIVVHHHRRLLSIYDYEKKNARFTALNRSIAGYCRHAAREKKTICGDHMGFHDFYVPVVQQGECVAILLSGAFSKQEITYDQLANNWKSITGETASSLNSNFREFARVALQTPVLTGKVFEAFQEALEIFAKILSGETKGENHSENILRLILDVFSKQLPHSFWLDWALGRPCNQSTPQWNPGVKDWGFVRNEIGILRLPTTVIAVIPQSALGKKEDAIEASLRIYRFQRWCFQFAKTMPQTVGGALEDYGALFVTSVEPRKNKFQPRRQIEETANNIRRFAERELHCPVLIGVGSTLAPGQVLQKSYQEAVLALHQGKEMGKDIVFHSGGHRKDVEDDIRSIRRLVLDLAKSVKSATLSDWHIFREQLLKKILTASFRNTEEIRLHFEYSLLTLVEAMREWRDVGKEEADRLFESLWSLIENATTTQEKILAFQEALNRLSEYVLKPSLISLSLSLEKIRLKIDESFHLPFRVTELAKGAGMSPATFSRSFKKWAGKGLGAYLQEKRLAEAGRLLKTSNLPISEIARQCGFRSPNYFANLFHRKMGRSPQQFRLALRNL